MDLFNLKEFFLEIRKKLATSQKKIIYEFFANILSIAKKLNTLFLREIKFNMFEKYIPEEMQKY